MQRAWSSLISFSLTALVLTGCHQAVPALPGTAHPAYTITDLGVGMPSDLNNRGQVVGIFPAGVFPNSKGFPYFHGCLWDKGKRIEMPTFGGWYSDAGRITDRGQIIGSATFPGHDAHNLPLRHGCLWDGVKLTDLEADPRFRGTGVVHITQSGAVYMVSPPQGPKKQIHLWLFPSGFGPGPRRDAGVIGDSKLNPTAINDTGMVAGSWKTGKKHSPADVVGIHHAFVWHPGDQKWTDLSTFGDLDSKATGLNNAGQVIGDATLPDGPMNPRFRSHAFLWETGKMRELGTLPGGNSSHPYAINDKGQIVGYSAINGSDLQSRPVLWEHGQIKDLTKLIPSGTHWACMEGATSINDRGQIVGDGAITNSNNHYTRGYLLTPKS